MGTQSPCNYDLMNIITKFSLKQFSQFKHGNNNFNTLFLEHRRRCSRIASMAQPIEKHNQIHFGIVQILSITSTELLISVIKINSYYSRKFGEIIEHICRYPKRLNLMQAFAWFYLIAAIQEEIHRNICVAKKMARSGFFFQVKRAFYDYDRPIQIFVSKFI